MLAAINLSDELVDEAKPYAKAEHRTVSRQIEHWARIGRLAEDNPELPLGFVRDALLGLEEIKTGQSSNYTFG